MMLKTAHATLAALTSFRSERSVIDCHGNKFFCSMRRSARSSLSAGISSLKIADVCKPRTLTKVRALHGFRFFRSSNHTCAADSRARVFVRFQKGRPNEKRASVSGLEKFRRTFATPVPKLAHPLTFICRNHKEASGCGKGAHALSPRSRRIHR